MILTYVIIAITSITSIIAFPEQVRSIDSIRRPEWFEKYLFNGLSVVKYKEYYRMISYGFIHANWMHLFFNMLTLYFFGGVVEQVFGMIFPRFGGLMYVLFYIVAIGVSTIHDLIIHKNHSYYNAVGASGAVSAVLFAAILFMPNSKLYLFFIPIPITAWIFGILYLIYSAYMAKKQMDNIGHNAHFWGAVFGFVFPIIIKPQLLLLFFEQILIKI